MTQTLEATTLVRKEGYDLDGINPLTLKARHSGRLGRYEEFVRELGSTPELENGIGQRYPYFLATSVSNPWEYVVIGLDGFGKGSGLVAFNNVDAMVHYSTLGIGKRSRDYVVKDARAIGAMPLIMARMEQ